MGLAASQARLLSLTARQHDVEYRAQKLEAQKLQMSNESDMVYQNYQTALNATKIQFKRIGSDGETYFEDTKPSDLFKSGYILTNMNNQIILSTDIANNYNQYSNDPYKFAVACCGGSAWQLMGLEEPYPIEGNRINNGVSFSINEALIYKNHKDTDPVLKALYENTHDFSNTDNHTEEFYSEGDRNQIKNETDPLEKAKLAWELLKPEKKAEELANRKAFRDYFFRNYGNEVIQYNNWTNENNYTNDYLSSHPELVENLTFQTDLSIQNKINFYLDLHNRITEAGGASAIATNYIDSNEWLTNGVNSGLVTISKYDYNNAEFENTNVATSTDLQEVSDEANLKKAEAEYEASMKKINRKETQIDTKLEKCESERTAIKTEQDSLKQIAKDNVDMAFKLFS